VQFSLNHVIIGAFALSGAVATATWNIRDDRIEELSTMVDAYEKSQELKLSETILKIGKASDHLNTQLEVIIDNKKLQELLNQANLGLKEKDNEIAVINREHTKELDDFKVKLEVTTDNLNQKIEFINNLYNTAEEFSIYENRSKKLFGLDVVISVTSLILNEFADMIVNNKSVRMYPGNVIPVNYKEEKCKLLLNQITAYKKVDFTFVCENKSNKLLKRN
jgi:hypothetical protein